MAKRPHILLIDPAPARDGLADHLKALGAACTVARGLHDAMVQCIIRNPVVIVADLSVPGGAGAECRRRLAELPHFRPAPFVTIGPGQELSASASDDEVAERVRTHLPGLEDAPPPEADRSSEAPEAPEAEAAPAAPSEALAGVLERLRRERTDATLMVRGRDGGLGEVMVRGGLPVHAVTADGLDGEEALGAMGGWNAPEIEVGPPPRPETPVTLARPEPDGPARRHEEDRRVAGLLGELEALGVVRRTGP